MNLKKMERYLRANLLGPGPRLMKKEFTGPRAHRSWETLLYNTTQNTALQHYTKHTACKQHAFFKTICYQPRRFNRGNTWMR